MSIARACCLFGMFLWTHGAAGDDLLYRYEGDVLPYDESAGWFIADPCDPPCEESSESGRFVLRWPTAGDFANYHRSIALLNEPQPPSLWVEWRFRSNHPLGPIFSGCDGGFLVNYGTILEVVYTYGDGAVSIEGGDAATGLALDEFANYRFESLDGISYRFSVNGNVFLEHAGIKNVGSTFIQLFGRGGCTGDQIPNQKHEWDFVRYGTISFGETIAVSDPPSGFVDARAHAKLDRFTVTYDSPNYAYVDDITVEVSGGDAPVVLQTRRRENDEPDTLEIVLDRPIPMGETTRFTFNDGTAVNVIEYTFAPADTDGDGDADLGDFAAFQRCFGQPPTTGPCLALDFDGNNIIDLTDHAAFVTEQTEGR